MDWLQRLKATQGYPIEAQGALETDKPTIATLAIAAPEPTPAPVGSFEPHGEPLPCKFWRQVCHAVGMYQDKCTGTGDAQCSIFRFLVRNTGENGNQALQNAQQGTVYSLH